MYIKSYIRRRTYFIFQFAYQPPAVYDLMDAINQTGLPIIKDMNDPNTPDGFVIAQAFNA